MARLFILPLWDTCALFVGVGCLVFAVSASEAQEGGTGGIGRFELIQSPSPFGSIVKFDTATAEIWFAKDAFAKAWTSTKAPPVKMVKNAKVVPGRFRLTLWEAKETTRRWLLWDSITGNAWYTDGVSLPNKDDPESTWRALPEK